MCFFFFYKITMIYIYYHIYNQVHFKNIFSRFIPFCQNSMNYCYSLSIINVWHIFSFHYEFLFQIMVRDLNSLWGRRFNSYYKQCGEKKKKKEKTGNHGRPAPNKQHKVPVNTFSFSPFCVKLIAEDGCSFVFLIIGMCFL